MTTSTLPRFYVETSNAEDGWYEYDAFNQFEDADKLARQLVRGGAPYAYVIDRVEMNILSEYYPFCAI